MGRFRPQGWVATPSPVGVMSDNIGVVGVVSDNIGVVTCLVPQLQIPPTPPAPTS